MEVDAMVARQLELGGCIEKLLSNYNKDSKDRKTIEYLNTRLHNLEQSWQEFEANDDNLREVCVDPDSQEYFVKEYYQQVEKVYLKLKHDIIGRIQKFNEHKINKPGSVQEAPKAFTSTEFLVRALSNAMTTMRSILATIAMTPLDSTTVVQHLIGRLERYLSIMEEREQSISVNGQRITYPEEEYRQLQVDAEQRLLELKRQLNRGQQQDESTLNIIQPLMKLSHVSIPKFNGDPTKWIQFHDLFTQLVHNQGISNAVKMFYLKDNVSGEAERVIRHLNVSDVNYEVAWAILKEKYDDQRELLNHWLEKLVNQRAIVNATSEGIKQLHDRIRETTLAINSLRIDPPELWEAMILFLISTKLDNTSKTLYEQSITNPQALPPLGEFIRFLHTRYRSLNTKGLRIQATPKQYKARMVTAAVKQKLECIICNKDHSIYQCNRFLQLRASQGNEAAFKAKLCLNCLRKGHFANKFKSRAFIKCGKRHNTLLHPLDSLTIPHVTQSSNVPTTLSIQAMDASTIKYAFWQQLWLK